jgi:HEAT repeat protein
MKIAKFAPVAALLLTWGMSAMGGESQPVANPQVEKLVAVLKSDAPQKEKADACRELARIGTKDAVPALAALLGDEKLSHMARYGLETIPDPAVDEALRAALGKLQGRPLVGVIGSIGVRRDNKAVPALAGFLKDSDGEVLDAAARALGSIADRPAAKALEDVLGSIPPANQPAVCEGLFRCAEAFVARGWRSQAVAIYDRLRSNQTRHQIRAGALRGSILNRKDGLELLVQVLHSSDYSLAAAAAHVSLEMPGGEVTSALADEVAKLPADRQILVIQMLGKRADPRALPTLSEAAKQGPKPVRIAAVKALAELEDPSATPLLVDLITNVEGDQDVARQAQETLASLQGAAVDDAVLAMLDSSQTNRRNAGLELAVRRRMATALSPMFKIATRGEPAARVVAVRKLAELAPASELPAFFDLLAKAQSPEDLEATEQAVSTLCLKAGDANHCAETVASRFPQADADRRCALLRVLGAVGGPQALKQVRAAVGETNAAVHAAAIRVLGSWNSLDAAPDLLELAQNAADPTDKTLALRSYLGLAGHADFPADRRLAMCRQAAPLVQKEDEKKLLLAAAGNLNSPEALEIIKPYFEDAATKEEAATAAVNVSEKILQGNDASRAAAGLIEPLENVAQLTSNSDLAGRAKKLVELARKKAEAK